MAQTGAQPINCHCVAKHNHSGIRNGEPSITHNRAVVSYRFVVDAPIALLFRHRSGGRT